MIEDRPIIEVDMNEWGFEKHIVNEPHSRGSLLYMIRGKFTPLHYHRTKHETLFVHSGKIRVLFFDGGQKEFEKFHAKMGTHLVDSLERTTLNPGDNFYVPPGRIHQLFASEDAQIYEFSSVYGANDTVQLTKGG